MQAKNCNVMENCFQDKYCMGHQSFTSHEYFHTVVGIIISIFLVGRARVVPQVKFGHDSGTTNRVAWLVPVLPQKIWSTPREPEGTLYLRE